MHSLNFTSFINKLAMWSDLLYFVLASIVGLGSVWCRNTINPFYVQNQLPVLQFGSNNLGSVIARVLNQRQFQPRHRFETHQYQPKPTLNQFTDNNVSKRDREIPKRESEVEDDTIKILDGVTATAGEFPFLAALKSDSDGRPNCGGSIFDSHHIITAGHCVGGFLRDPSQLFVTVGEYDVRKKDKYEQTLQVEAICVHFSYNDTLLGYDIAIVRLRERIQFFPGVVERAKFPPRDGEVVDIRRGTADIVGWGFVIPTRNGNHVRPDVLQTTYVKLYEGRECKDPKKIDVPYVGSSSRIICAGDDSPTKDGRARDVCHGDSGSPIICSGVVCGLVSSGDICEKDSPVKRGFYTRVHSYRKWIHDYVRDGDESQCFKL